MKYRMMMNLIAGAGMVATPLLAAASDFGGGWKQDKDTGTLYYSLAPEHGRHQAGTDGHRSGNLNSFGGGWVQDRVTGTIYYSRAHDVSHGTESADRQSAVSKAEGGRAYEPVRRTF